MSTFFASNLKYLRAKKGVTQQFIADLTGKGNTAVVAWESGTSDPRFPAFTEIINFFEVTADQMLYQDLENVDLNPKSNFNKNELTGRPNSRPNGRPNEKNDKNLVQESEPETQYATHPKTLLPKVVVVDPQGRENVVFVPVKARAGYLVGYGDTEYVRKLPVYRLPGLNNGTFRAFEVAGVSMESLFYEGDVVICRWVEKLKDVRERDIYVFLTQTEGIAIKRVLSHITASNKILLGSENPLYSPVLVDYEEIREIWHPIAYMSTNFRTQNNLENRISELETRLFRIEEKQAIHPLK